jgi:hypothetical protein
MLNTAIVLVFACAWIADRWPSLTLLALLFAFIIVAGEVIILCLLSAKKASSGQAHSPREEIDPPFAEEVDYSIVSDDDADQRRKLARERLVRLVLKKFAEQHASRNWPIPTIEHRGDNVELDRWAAVLAKNYAAASYALYLLETSANKSNTAPQRNARRLPAKPELVNWKIVTHGGDAFNVEAGAFEIEHFGGHTNIRVLDPSRVTIEGTRRGVKSEVAPADISVPIYQ